MAPPQSRISMRLLPKKFVVSWLVPKRSPFGIEYTVIALTDGGVMPGEAVSTHDVAHVTCWTSPDVPLQFPSSKLLQGSGAVTVTSLGQVSNDGHAKARSSDSCVGGGVTVGCAMKPEIK